MNQCPSTVHPHGDNWPGYTQHVPQFMATRPCVYGRSRTIVLSARRSLRPRYANAGWHYARHRLLVVRGPIPGNIYNAPGIRTLMLYTARVMPYAALFHPVIYSAKLNTDILGKLFKMHIRAYGPVAVIFWLVQFDDLSKLGYHSFDNGGLHKTPCQISRLHLGVNR